MNLKYYLERGNTVELNHNYSISAKMEAGIFGYSLLCGGNFVCYSEDLDCVIAHYGRLVTA